MATSISKIAEVVKLGGVALGFRDIVKAEGGRGFTNRTTQFNTVKFCIY